MLFSWSALHRVCFGVGCMEVTVAYCHSLLHPDIVKRDFEEIRSAGARRIVYAIHEQEAQRWPRDLETSPPQAHAARPKVYICYTRYQNLIAVPSPAPTSDTFHHPQSRL